MLGVEPETMLKQCEGRVGKEEWAVGRRQINRRQISRRREVERERNKVGRLAMGRLGGVEVRLEEGILSLGLRNP